MKSFVRYMTESSLAESASHSGDEEASVIDEGIHSKGILSVMLTR